MATVRLKVCKACGAETETRRSVCRTCFNAWQRERRFALAAELQLPVVRVRLRGSPPGWPAQKPADPPRRRLTANPERVKWN